MPINHLVQQGDSAISLSLAYGLFASTIWEDSANAELRKKRPDMNTLLPGDVLVIPDKRLRLEKRPTGATHSFRRKGIPALLRLQVFDMHIPRANQAFSLTVDGVLVKKGQSDAHGIVEGHVSPSAKSGEIVIGDDEHRIALLFGHLDPLSEVAGLQGRLNNLGYGCGAVTGELNDATQAALRRLQSEHGLTESGQSDEATRDLLERLHAKTYDYGMPGGAAP